jgi:N-acetylneuraminic acid mutarotase
MKKMHILFGELVVISLLIVIGCGKNPVDIPPSQGQSDLYRESLTSGGGKILASIQSLSPSMFSPTGSMSTIRGNYDGFTLTKLCDGRVLAAGGSNSSGTLASAELYNPATGTWSPTGSMNFVRSAHSATLLDNCEVLVAGGNDGSGGYRNSAELYDPALGTWSLTGSFSTVRARHTAAKLNNGKVLIVAGLNGSGWYGIDSAELYDPALGTWSLTGSLITCDGEQGARGMQGGVLLSDGKVLIAGGMPQGVTGSNFKSAEIYDPALGTWSCTGSMAIGRRHSFTLTLLPDGKVLVAGGVTDWTGPQTNKAELYNPATGIWTPTTNLLPAARADHSATLLSDGKVLVAGGYSGTYLNTALIFDPAAQTWSSTANTMGEVRCCHNAVSLSDGRVLVVGGYNGTVNLSTAELYGITVQDTTPPTITLNGDNPITLECPASYVEPGAVASDAVDPSPSLSIAGSVNSQALGTYVITYTAMDASGNSSLATRTVNVVDTTPPSLTVSASPTSLWPPNHKYRMIALSVSASDSCDPSVALSATAVSNEPDDANGVGDGQTTGDIRVTTAGGGVLLSSNSSSQVSFDPVSDRLELRAERSGTGTGRTYTITVTATDGSGNQSTSTVAVAVPHN